MTGRTHVFVSAAVGAAVGAITHQPLIPMEAVGLVGGLGPDIDHSRSILSRCFWPLYLIAPPVELNRWRNGRRWLRIWVVWHRGQIHSIALGLPVAAGLAVLWPWLGVAFFAGWLAHLAVDLPQPTRLPFVFWPIRRRPIKLPAGLPAFAEDGWVNRRLIEPVVKLVSGAVVVLLAAPDVLHGFVSVVAAGR